MLPEGKDQAFLWDMREAAGDISRTVLELNAQEFVETKFTRLAVERLAMILGVAAAKLSDAYRLAHPELGWRRIQGLDHEYGAARAQELYRTCREFVVPLSRQLDALCPLPPADNL
ncbi:MAG: hypothetical protein J0I12_21745 [Candidatus Eremiobacteraeota bacterium]|nr:hypothetical protein [Candidatus Eremiobacteraeota bacterium]